MSTGVAWRRALARAPEEAGWAAPAFVLVLLVPLMFRDGGFFAESWGVPALFCAWVALMGALWTRTIALPRVEAVWVGALAALALWQGLSALWSIDASRSVLDAERGLLYALAALAAVTVVSRASAWASFAALHAVLVAACAYGLATRLFPERLGFIDPHAEYRLAEPLGYWNAMGAVAAMGVVLGLGLATFGGRATRAWGAASVVVTATALYFTFSRGAVLALAVALVLALSWTRSGRLAATAVLVALPSMLVIAVGATSEALTRRDAQLADASREGHRVALVLLAAAAAAAAAPMLAPRARIQAPRWRRGYTVAAAVVAVALAAAAAPAIWSAFGDRPEESADLNRRFASLSGAYRSEMWSAAADEWRAHPLAGGGAGSFERWWLAHRDIDYTVEDAHSLYVEAAAETGIVGLAIVLVAVGAPFAVAGRARRRPAAAVALAAYAGFAVHAGLDWQWEMPALTVAALLAAAIALGASREADAPSLARRPRLALAVAVGLLSAISFAGLVANHALSRAEDAIVDLDWREAHDAADRAAWIARWSEEPWLRHAEAWVEQGHLARARDAYRRASEADGGSWEAWLGLARTSSGREREDAFARARALNPRARPILRFAEEGR